MSEEKHPSWFKMKIERRELIQQLAPETAVNVLLACWEYLETNERPRDLSPIEKVAFASFMPDMEEAWTRYLQRINAKKEWLDRQKSPDIEQHQSTSDDTEEDKDNKNQIKRNRHKDSVYRTGKPSTRTRLSRNSHGQYGWVKLSEDEYNCLLNDLGETELERCIAYIDESAQSSGNKNKWRDWNLVIRRCHRDGWGLGTAAGKSKDRDTIKTVEDYDSGDSFV